MTARARKIATWNVNGIRAREAQLVDWIALERPDVLCLQELKASPEQLSSTLFTLSEYWNYWHGARGGYSGVSLHLRKESFPEPPVFSHPSFDAETRIVQARVDDVVFASIYVPNGGKDFVAKMAFVESLVAWTAELEREGARLVLCGDMNIARDEVDVHPSQRKPNLIGQRPDERALFEQILSHGLVDVQRALAPTDERLYTWWPYWRQARERNLGWRLDYVIAAASLAQGATACEVRKEIGTSDHAPLVVTFAGL
jgi:exodeoxyribonuclease-3